MTLTFLMSWVVASLFVATLWAIITEISDRRAHRLWRRAITEAKRTQRPCYCHRDHSVEDARDHSIEATTEVIR